MTKLIPISEQVRVVWNLTNACPYECPHCAAAANHHIESGTDKLAILNSIRAIDRPLHIDFSGGDPLFHESDIDVIRNTVSFLDKSHIDISTTGASLSKLSDDTVRSLAGSYSLTYDYPRSLSDPYRNGNSYNFINYEQALRLKSLDIPFDIMLPVRTLPDHISFLLAANLATLEPQHIGLLQLMSTGNNVTSAPFSPADAARLNQTTRENASRFIRHLRYHGYQGQIICNCVIRHCCSAMTGLKIGLDQFGNAFGCLWAANLNLSHDRNPFYIGNVLDLPISEILYRLETRASTLDRSRCFVCDCCITPGP